MKIVVGVTYSYPYIGSGIGNVAVKQAEELAKLGHDVTLISSNFPKSKREFTRNKVKYLKGKLILRLEKIGLPIPLFFLNKKMKKVIKNADIVHIHDSLYPSSYQIAKFAKKFNKKIILTQHIGFIQYKSFIAKLIERIVYNTIGKNILNKASKILVLNEGVKDYLLKLSIPENKISFLPNGVDIKLFKPTIKENKIKIRKEYNLPLDKPIVLFVGRLVEKKGFDKLFEAKDANYLTIFVGGGNIPDNMKNDKNVLFFGEKTPDELSKIYQLSDIFCLPSHGEGFPLSIQEAMASGLPVITTDESNYKLYLNSSNSILIDSSAENIKKSIQKLLSDSNLIKNFSTEARKKAVTDFSWSKNLKGLCEAYKR
jgi:D-inositol-3-phosphate glycosyltransferase